MIVALANPRWRRFPRRAVAFLVCAIVVGMPLHGRAYQEFGVQVGSTTIKMKWNQMPVRYYIEGAGVPGVTATQLQTTVAASFDTWHNVPTSSVSAQFVDYTTAQPGGPADGLSVIGFVSDPDEPDVLGSTDWFVDTTTGEIIESDIFFNSVAPWSVAAGGESGHFDLQSIATHEIGHFWGLGHSALGETEVVPGGRRVIAKASVMFPIAFSSGNTRDRTLQPDDIAGISDLYPTSAFTAETGLVSGTVTKNGQAVFGAHVVAYSPTAGTLVGGFTQDDGSFAINGLTPGPVVVRVEPLDDADLDAFFDPASAVDVNFNITYYGRFAIVPPGGGSGPIQIHVTPK